MPLPPFLPPDGIIAVVAGDEVFEYVAWFRDDAVPHDDQDHEWPGVLFIRARDRDSALAWGDELARTCADPLIRSAAAAWAGPVPASAVVVPHGERRTAAALGW